MIRITSAMVRRALPRRHLEAQKWDFGHCLIVAGSRNMLGAALLAAKAALRGGAGLVTLALPKSLQPLVYAQILEALTLPLEETQEGSIDFRGLCEIGDYIKNRHVTALVLGPGLSRHESTAELVRALVRQAPLPTVLDADALVRGLDFGRPGFRCLTPHERELSCFLGVTLEEVRAKGSALAQALVKEHPNLAVVLKGHHSRIFMGESLWVNPTGNPGMAKGGSGDVLSGLLGSLLAQRAAREATPADLMDAVLAAVYLHGLAGDMAAKEMSSYAMTPQDMIQFLPRAIKSAGAR